MSRVYIDQVIIKLFKSYYLSNSHFEYRGKLIKITDKAYCFVDSSKKFQWIPKSAVIHGEACIAGGAVRLQEWFNKSNRNEIDPETKYYRNVATCAERFSGDWAG